MVHSLWSFYLHYLSHLPKNTTVTSLSLSFTSRHSIRYSQQQNTFAIMNFFFWAVCFLLLFFLLLFSAYKIQKDMYVCILLSIGHKIQSKLIFIVKNHVLNEYYMTENIFSLNAEKQKNYIYLILFVIFFISLFHFKIYALILRKISQLVHLFLLRL